MTPRIRRNMIRIAKVPPSPRIFSETAVTAEKVPPPKETRRGTRTQEHTYTSIRKIHTLGSTRKIKNDSCEIRGFRRNSSLQAAWDTSNAGTAGAEGNKP